MSKDRPKLIMCLVILAILNLVRRVTAAAVVNSVHYQPLDSQFLFTISPQHGAEVSTSNLFHMLPEVVVAGNDSALESMFLEQNTELWTTIQRKPDHEILVGFSVTSPNAIPSAIKQDFAFAPSFDGTQDFVIDSMGGGIIQTFFGQRTEEMDDNDHNEIDYDREYDIECDDDKNECRKRDEDDDDDESKQQTGKVTTN